MACRTAVLQSIACQDHTKETSPRPPIEGAFARRDRLGHISHYERTALLPRYNKVLRAGAVVRADIDQIKAIKLEFLSSLPMVGKTSEQAFLDPRSWRRSPIRYAISPSEQRAGSLAGAAPNDD